MESQGEDPWGPGRIRRCLEVLGRPAHGPQRSPRPQEHRGAAQAPAGWRREGESARLRAAVGSRTYVPSARRGRLRGTGVQGDLGRSHHAAAPGRAGQGRAGLRAAPSAAGVCLSLEARAGPSSQCRAEANGAPSPPTHRAASPPGWPPGRAGENEVGGDWVPGSPAEAFLENAARGRAHARGEDAWESKPRPRAAQDDFVGKL